MDIIRKAAETVRILVGDRQYQFLEKVIAYLIERTPILRTIFRKRLMEYLANQKAVRFLQKCIFDSMDEGKDFLDSLPTHDLINAERLFGKLTEVQKERIRETIDPNKKTIAIYLVGSGYSENLGNIADKLRSKGYNVPTLVGTSPAEVAEVYGAIRKDACVDACICLGAIENMPTDTKIIYFVHDIHDSAISYMNKVLRITPTFDFHFLPNPFALSRAKEQILAGREKFSGNTAMKKEVCLIAGGYPKLDSNLRYFQEHCQQDSKTIIYASTVMDDMADLVSLTRHGDEIIGVILNSITDYDLVFRPHPGTLGTPEVKRIVKKYRNHPRFVFDDNASFYMDNYSKSALMITGMSGTAYTYAFTTLRPVIFFSHNEVEVTRRFGDYQYFVDRSKIGYVAQNVDEMVEKIRLLLTSKGDFSSRIKEYRDSFVYNVGKSEDYFVDNIEYILEDKKHPDWGYF